MRAADLEVARAEIPVQAEAVPVQAATTPARDPAVADREATKAYIPGQANKGRLITRSAAGSDQMVRKSKSMESLSKSSIPMAGRKRSEAVSSSLEILLGAPSFDVGLLHSIRQG